MPKPKHKFTLDHLNEFDEVFVSNASVHIERMDEMCYYIGIEHKELPQLMIRTGVERGVWFFNIEVDSVEDHQFLSVQRPRKVKIALPRGKPRRS